MLTVAGTLKMSLQLKAFQLKTLSCPRTYSRAIMAMMVKTVAMTIMIIRAVDILRAVSVTKVTSVLTLLDR